MSKKQATRTVRKKSTATLHGVFDAMEAFEKRVQRSSHPRKSAMLRLAASSKNSWKRFCLQLQKNGDCPNPTSDFCEPKPKPPRKR